MERSYNEDVNIPNAATDSATISVPPGFVLAGIVTPAALTGSSVSLKGSYRTNPVSLFPVYDNETLYSIDVGANRVVMFDTNVTKGLAVFALVSASAEGASRTFTAIYTKGN